ncbi:pyridine nucleotide-disulfide oxidoreductase domain-containing protein 1 [Diaphorina citri]|uniref:Pyridine nucleotide-disulfide oxidoreductase domain-containing protein 1 n=2 Tax=Diaphorina citri TaxID=121845 RepID=A0A1S3D9I0_DIACI|nr:pyridine nucleotide-disulfide oxidoreductase domain-containing protein 1 [Diaphorina citri]
MEFTYLIIGGGIAGVSCVEGLAFLHPGESIGLVTPSGIVKAVTKTVPVTKLLSDITVEETDANKFEGLCTVIVDTVAAIDPRVNCVITEKQNRIKYKTLCICTGASPRKIWYSPHVITIRDTDSVAVLQEKLKSAKKIVVIGNGGIATELVHELSNVDIVWVVKDKHISATFLDPGAAEFFQDSINKTNTAKPETIFKRMRYNTGGEKGPSLGPDWHTQVNLHGSSRDTKITIEYSCEVERIVDSEDDTCNAYVKLTNGHTHACDIVVSAIGVVPNSNIQVHGTPFELAPDCGIGVNELMQTSISNVYAAGDVCTPSWDLAKQWFQMRLWTQAKHMGTYAAKCMVGAVKNEPVIQDFSFEMFTHMTKFFGYKVILLGLFNGQTLENDYEILLRVTRGEEYIKLVMKDGRMQGAVLIGETEIEEMCENLILNQLDLTDIADDLLNPNIDIDDYFD